VPRRIQKIRAKTKKLSAGARASASDIMEPFFMSYGCHEGSMPPTRSHAFI
jgi:hypothetical protein